MTSVESGQGADGRNEMAPGGPGDHDILCNTPCSLQTTSCIRSAFHRRRILQRGFTCSTYTLPGRSVHQAPRYDPTPWRMCDHHHIVKRLVFHATPATAPPTHVDCGDHPDRTLRVGCAGRDVTSINNLYLCMKTFNPICSNMQFCRTHERPYPD